MFIHNEDIISKYPSNYTCIVANVKDPDLDQLDAVTRNNLACVVNNRERIEATISMWQQNFINMGAKPKYCSSLESLMKYYNQNDKLYSISPIVDFYNSYSLSMGLPMAAYNQDAIAGHMCLRLAQKDEPFVPLGNPKQIEKTKNNEVIYADDEKTICRYWNLQDCHPTRITEDTKTIMFVFDIWDDELMSASSKFDSISTDFKMIFGGNIFCGLTGKNIACKLEW